MAVYVSDMNGEYMVGDDIDLALLESPIVTEKKNTYSFSFGDAAITQITFSGICIIHGDMVLYQDRKLYFEMGEQDYLVEMHFSLAGGGVLDNHVDGKRVVFRQNEHNMHYTPQFAGVGQFAGNERYKFLEVHFAMPFFLSLAKESGGYLARFAESVEKHKSAELGSKNLPISFAMHQCIRDIMACNFKGRLKLLFLQSKCIELLTLQAQMYEEMEGADKKTKPVRNVDSIHFAKDYLLQHIANPPSLTELAKLSGINEFKLKQGFKEVFNNTVFGYLSDYKLDKARDLLISGGTTIKAAADELGYSSVQHFSNAFRKKYGMPPGRLKK